MANGTECGKEGEDTENYGILMVIKLNVISSAFQIKESATQSKDIYFCPSAF